MTPGALATSVAILILTLVSVAPARAEPERVRGCMSPAQARDVLIQQKFLAPFHALGVANRNGQGDVVGLQLCRYGEQFVYDVTLLRHDGRVIHTLVDARSGDVVAPVHTAK